MSLARGLGTIGVLLLAYGCRFDSATESAPEEEEPRLEGVMDFVEAGRDVLIADYFVPDEEVLLDGESPDEAIERAIRDLIAIHPRFAEDPVISSLRGEAGWMLVSIPSDWEEAAAVIARGYQARTLKDAERREARVEELRKRGLAADPDTSGEADQ